MPTVALKTFHMTPSVHGGVVRLPMYLKYPFRLALDKSGNMSDNLKTPKSHAFVVVVVFIKNESQGFNNS